MECVVKESKGVCTQCRFTFRDNAKHSSCRNSEINYGESCFSDALPLPIPLNDGFPSREVNLIVSPLSIWSNYLL